MIPYAVTIDYIQQPVITTTLFAIELPIYSSYENNFSKVSYLEHIHHKTIKSSEYILNKEEQKAMKRALISSSTLIAKGKLII
jgi:hypothetical protein